MNQRHIIIGMCTYKRPQVRETIASLCTLQVPDNCRLSLVVCDNDNTRSGELAVTEAAHHLPFDWKYMHAPAHNISIARNAILQDVRSRGADYLAFLDDDEHVGSNWLAALFARHTLTGAGAIVGPVRAEYSADAPAWMIKGSLHDTVPDVDANGFAHTGYTCNMLVDLSHPALDSLEFDVALGQSGGEDTDLFARYLERGGRIAFAPDAPAFETVPPARAQFQWLLRRRFRMGQTHGAIVCADSTMGMRAVQAAKAGAKVAACMGMAMVNLPSQLKRNQAVLRAALHFGALTACFGSEPLRLYVPNEPVSKQLRGTSK